MGRRKSIVRTRHGGVMSDESSMLQQFGVDPNRLAQRAREAAEWVPQAKAEWEVMLAASPDPGVALANWERFTEDPATRLPMSQVTTSELAAILRLMGSSQWLANFLQGAGSTWLNVYRQALVAPRRNADDYEPEIQKFIDAPWSEFCRDLRHLRNREYLRIALADLDGRYSVATTVAELSALADGACSAAVQWTRREMRELYGEMWCRPPSRGKGGVANSFVVLGMGKLGGQELNFSSDIDLIYLYDADGMSSAGGSRGVLEARPYFIRMAERVTKALQEITQDGFVFRVDLRLRPDGVNGPIANSLTNTLLYYELHGQTWERTALIQARPIAGDIKLGERFLDEVQPFVYRRYLDYATVADMKAMKSRVEHELPERTGRFNVKLGRGGIREIEFLVQVLQLIHGGRDERLRGGGSQRLLPLLVAGGYLAAEEGDALLAAYRFLRDVEHKIQIVQQRQTHSIPDNGREQEALARRLLVVESATSAELWRQLDTHRRAVRQAFEKLFYEPTEERQRAVDSATAALLHQLEDREAAIVTLEAMGFLQAEQSYSNLILLRDGPQWAPAHAKRRKALFDLAPALFAAILKSPDPDLSLQNMATFISSIGARTSFLALLQENPATLRMLADLFGGSQYLANWFIRHPELLDSLVRADLVKLHRTVEEQLSELRAVCGGAVQIEEQLDALRRFRNLEFLRVGINDLQEALEPEAVSHELTNVADACVQIAYEIAERGVCEKMKIRRLPGQCIVLGMGKLGSRELNYNSDLDLIFVYEAGRSRRATADAQEWFARLAQRLMMVLQTTTREGIAYRIDTRLRPSGNKGPLVTSFDGFRAYHESSAQLWERQALIKARPVAGHPDLAARVASVVDQFVYRVPLYPSEVAEIRRIRQRMEQELARESGERVNIKIGRGGLIDIEFVTQMLQMCYGTRNPEVRCRATLDALRALAGIGALQPDDHALLDDGYRFIRRVENTLRLTHDRPVEGLDRGAADLRVAAKRLGFSSDVAAFWKAWEARREAVRGCYDRYFVAAESPPASAH